MHTLFASPATTSPDILTSKYRPRRIADFVGLDKPCNNVRASLMQLQTELLLAD